MLPRVLVAHGRATRAGQPARRRRGLQAATGRGVFELAPHQPLLLVAAAAGDELHVGVGHGLRSVHCHALVDELDATVTDVELQVGTTAAKYRLQLAGDLSETQRRIAGARHTELMHRTLVVENPGLLPGEEKEI